MMLERMVEGNSLESDKQLETSLRPLCFEDFPGQAQVKDKLKVFVSAAKKRGEALDHTLLCGPPGLGKTTLARIIAEEMGVEFRSTSAPAIEKKGDLAALLTSLKPHSVLFIDEIHRLSRVLEEYLYTAMEDYFIDIMTGEGLGARIMKFELAPFTLIGATTRAGLLHGPFIDRFGIVERLQFYDRASLEKIVSRSAGILKMEVDDYGIREVAKRSRGTPRVANRLLKRVRDYAEIHGQGVVNEHIAEFALDQLGVDQHGLDEMDRQILMLIHEKFNGGPVGVETMAAALSEERDTLEEVYEPYLLQEGFIMKTPRGRVVTDLARMMLEALPKEANS